MYVCLIQPSYNLSKKLLLLPLILKLIVYTVNDSIPLYSLQSLYLSIYSVYIPNCTLQESAQFHLSLKEKKVFQKKYLVNSIISWYSVKKRREIYSFIICTYKVWIIKTLCKVLTKYQTIKILVNILNSWKISDNV